MTERDLHQIHEMMLRQLQSRGAHIEAVYWCPHDIGQCSCRKPNVGMFVRAARELIDLPLEATVVIGDSEADMRAAARLGIPKVLVGRATAPNPTVAVDYAPASLFDAVKWLHGLERGPLLPGDREEHICHTIPAAARDQTQPEILRTGSGEAQTARK
jgi:D-glycero-D-manno-heptose 1,7-bisphosphate phosphatase